MGLNELSWTAAEKPGLEDELHGGAGTCEGAGVLEGSPHPPHRALQLLGLLQGLLASCVSEAERHIHAPSASPPLPSLSFPSHSTSLLSPPFFTPFLSSLPSPFLPPQPGPLREATPTHGVLGAE